MSRHCLFTLKSFLSAESISETENLLSGFILKQQQQN